MTPAEFRCRKEALGLSNDWIADQTGINLTTVKRSQLDRQVPDILERLLVDLEAEFDEDVEECARKPVVRVPRKNMPDHRAPGRTFPAEWYRLIAAEANSRYGCHIEWE